MSDKLMASVHSTIGAGVAPAWVQLVPSGKFQGADRRGPYNLSNPQAVISASLAAGPIPIDENHATDFAAATGTPSPARGWIVAMEARDTGLWGRVEWTPTGLVLMAERAYRGISPVFVHDKSGTVVRVLRAALTNSPNLTQLASLNTMEGAFSMLSHAPGQSPAALTPVQRAVCQRMNIDQAAFARHAQVMSGEHGGIVLTEAERTMLPRMNGAPKLTPKDFLASKAATSSAPNTDGDGLDLTAEERAVCLKMGIDQQEYSAWKKRPIPGRRDGQVT